MTGFEDIGKKLHKIAAARQSDRQAKFDAQWQTISQYFFPQSSDINTQRTEGSLDWTQQIYDTQPIRAASTCAIGVRNWVTPATENWLGLAPPPNLMASSPAARNPRLARLAEPQGNPVDADGMDDATRWCAEVAEQLTEELQASRFYSVVQPFNKGACIFGTALMYCGEGKTSTFHFEQFKVGTFTIAENDQKIVDTVDRWFKLSLRQAAQRWGKKNLPSKQQDLIAAEKYDQKATYVHHVLPMEDFKELGGTMPDDGGVGASRMAFASVYQDDDTKEIVALGGYEEMPYFCLRWDSWGSDDQPYGYSPAFETLTDARQLNYVVESYDALVEQKAFPRLFVPDSQTGEVEYAPGSVTVVKGEDMEHNRLPQEWGTKGETLEIVEIIKRKEQAINDAFFVDVFKALGMLLEKDMTATEVAQRVGEKLDQFTGTFDQYRTEVINLLIPRCLGIMLRAGRLPKAPLSLMVRPGNDPQAAPELAVPKILIKSRVTLAMNEIKNAAVEKTLSVLQPLAKLTANTPRDVLDNFETDELSRGTGRDFGLREKYFRSTKSRDAIRQQRAKQIAEQRALEMAQMAAKAGKDIGRAPQGMQDAVMEQFPKAGNQ
jgi:hypothetical protein